MQTRRHVAYQLSVTRMPAPAPVALALSAGLLTLPHPTLTSSLSVSVKSILLSLGAKVPFPTFLPLGRGTDFMFL